MNTISNRQFFVAFTQQTIAYLRSLSFRIDNKACAFNCTHRRRVLDTQELRFHYFKIGVSPKHWRIVSNCCVIFVIKYGANCQLLSKSTKPRYGSVFKWCFKTLFIREQSNNIHEIVSNFEKQMVSDLHLIPHARHIKQILVESRLKSEEVLSM